MFQVFGDEGQLCLVAAVVGLAPVLGWILIHNWYFRRITYFQSQVQHQDGRLVPSQPPRLLVGHLVEVYQSDNRLAAYHRFHEQLGEIVQIFWLWRGVVA
jgi:hypothetical protein